MWRGTLMSAALCWLRNKAKQGRAAVSSQSWPYLPPGVYSEELHGREDQNINGGQDKTSFQDSKSDIAHILIHVGLQSQTTKIEQNNDLHKECTEELTRTVREN